jgi:RHS repeat-associated protein
MQLFDYEWDEVGRLDRARRWDTSLPPKATDPLPTSDPDVDLRYAYDASDMRVLKTAVGEKEGLYTAYVFDSLELRRTAWLEDSVDPELSDYEDEKFSEIPYLSANGVRLARLSYGDDGVPGADLHVFLELADHLGSNGIVIDKATGELVERTTYQAYGATESDYRPARWNSFREDYRFTGKEEDVEVGLMYFGARYYTAALGRWISPDPLAVHGLGADLNVYAYVHGSVLRATDPTGLGENDTTQSSSAESLTSDPGARTDEGGPGGDAPVSAPPSTVPMPSRASISAPAHAMAVAAPDATPYVPYYSPSALRAMTVIVVTVSGGATGLLDLWHADANSRPDAGAAPTELPPGGTDWSAGGEGGLLSDPVMRKAAGVVIDTVALAAAAEVVAAVNERKAAAAAASGTRVFRMAKPVGADVAKVRVRHFTRAGSLSKIKESNVLIASDQNSVFTVLAKGKPRKAYEVEEALWIKQGKGGAYVDFDAMVDEYKVINNSRSGAKELVFEGNVDLAGRNPTFTVNR